MSSQVALLLALCLFFLLLISSLELAATAGSEAKPAASALEAPFIRPPDSARPWVYWIWLNGNITSNGITADLESMQRVGLGGALIMEVDQGTPAGQVKFGSPEWRALFQHTCAEARRLGLQINMNNDAGWCGSGGPWITPELSMQKVVWSETQVNGPRSLHERLAQPPTTRDFYRDIAVLAFPTLTGDLESMAATSPRVTLSDSPAEAITITEDLRLATFTLPKPTPEKPSWLQLEFDRPYTARELTLRLGLTGDQFCHGLLQASDDGVVFRDAGSFAAEARKLVFDFPTTTARYFRLLFHRLHPDLSEVRISELDLSPRLRIAQMEGKGCFMHLQSIPGPNQFPGRAQYPQVPKGFAIPRRQILNLTSHLHKDGRLDWDVPPGSWTLLRIGHTSTGVDNHPAPEAGRGLECDKLSKEGIQTVFKNFLKNLVWDNRSHKPGPVIAAHIDSWEVDSQNWTGQFREEFLLRRGYDLLPFLPALTGRPVDNLEISERFLWDFRQTIADLLVENYAGEFQRLAKRHGLRFTLEGYDAPCDDLTYASRADEPMGEFWTWPPLEMDYTCTAMASVAHTYGRQIIGAEAFTATGTERWLGHPFAVKPYGDWAFCEGINRLVVHRYALQPWTNPDRAPGMSMGPFGLHYERTQTWWDYSQPWHEYLARCQFLLRQGRYVADICYLEPQNIPQHWRIPFEVRDRKYYHFDVCSPEVVLKRMSVKNGRIRLPDGMSYRLLVLPEVETMTPELLDKLRELVKRGATLLGCPPKKSPSLMNFPDCDLQVGSLVKDLWGTGDFSRPGQHAFGHGRVIWGSLPPQVLADDGIIPDFRQDPGPASQEFRFLHRSLPEAEVYFIANPRLARTSTWCEFRVENMVPQLWWPDSGRMEPVASYVGTNGKTRLPLTLEAAGSVFVVFRQPGKPLPDHVVSIQREGRRLLDAQAADVATNLAHATNVAASASSQDKNDSTFTIAVWVKPDIDIPLPQESNHGQGSYMMERNDAIFAPPGHEVYSSPDHAGAGLSIGRNGVCVFEHAPFYFPPILVATNQLTNWTHVAVVYDHGMPRLHLNGKFVHQGLQSAYTVHSPVGVQHRRRIAPFQGGLGEFHGEDRALSAQEIKELMGQMPQPSFPDPMPAVQILQAATGALQAQVWEPGDYEVRTIRGKTFQFKTAEPIPPIELNGPWELRFPPDSGAPPVVHFPQLISWSEHADPGLRHFSGTATYFKTLSATEQLCATNRRVYLDLGKVNVMARVKLNGQDLGVLWKPPFRVEVTDVIHTGANTLQVEVVNLWVNQMIGDEALPDDTVRNPDGTLKQWPAWLENGRTRPTGRRTFSTWPLWKKDEALRESGLLGPVQLLSAETVWLQP